MIKLLISGCNGNMGKELQKEISITDNMEVVCGYSDFDSGINPFPVYTNTSNIQNISEIDCIIDFSVPNATMEILKFAKEHKKPLVIATTGLSNEQKEEIQKASNEIPILLSPNMSLQITLFNKILKEVYSHLKDCDIEIEEIHHNRKIDAPSGTAMLLAETLIDSSNGELSICYNRHDKHEKRSKKEIGMHALRGGNVVGKHSVFFFDTNESLTITHEAHSRAIFAKGALKAAEFIIYKENGLYNMEDVVS